MDMNEQYVVQVCNMLNTGIVILDKDFKVHYWNRWMEIHSGIPLGKITGIPIFDFFPNLNNPKFLRNCKSLFTFGNYYFLSQKLHTYIFPFHPVSASEFNFEFMQQSGSMFPLRGESGEIKYICLAIHDVTEMVSYEQKLLEMARRDILTGIYNRRFLEERMKEEFEKHRRYNRPLSLVIFDIDHFKHINDTCGHQYGDYILKSVTTAAKPCLRTVDTFARYGGEEFCCILPETHLTAALTVAERLRNAIATQEYFFNDTIIRATVSVGVSEVCENITTPDALFKGADDALYEAKKTGRNKVVSINNLNRLS
jgi:diguanylate cyclase (GGDEF)-like protein